MVDERFGLFVWGDNDPFSADANLVAVIFLASAVAAWFALLKCSASARKPFHLFLAILSVCCAASDATFAGLPGLGSTSLELSDAAKASITLPFIPVWTVLGVLNALAFVGGKGKSA